MTGFQLSEVKKPKPKARQAGREPCNSAIMTPASSTSTVTADAKRDDFENPVVAAEAAQGLGALGFVVDEREISLRDGCAYHLVYP